MSDTNQEHPDIHVWLITCNPDRELIYIPDWVYTIADFKQFLTKTYNYSELRDILTINLTNISNHRISELIHQDPIEQWLSNLAIVEIKSKSDQELYYSSKVNSNHNISEVMDKMSAENQELRSALAEVKTSKDAIEVEVKKLRQEVSVLKDWRLNKEIADNAIKDQLNTLNTMLLSTGLGTGGEPKSTLLANVVDMFNEILNQCQTANSLLSGINAVTPDQLTVTTTLVDIPQEQTLQDINKDINNKCDKSVDTSDVIEQCDEVSDLLSDLKLDGNCNDSNSSTSVDNDKDLMRQMALTVANDIEREMTTDMANESNIVTSTDPVVEFDDKLADISLEGNNGSVITANGDDISSDIDLSNQSVADMLAEDDWPVWEAVLDEMIDEGEQLLATRVAQEEYKVKKERQKTRQLIQDRLNGLPPNPHDLVTRLKQVETQRLNDQKCQDFLLGIISTTGSDRQPARLRSSRYKRYRPVLPTMADKPNEWYKDPDDADNELTDQLVVKVVTAPDRATGARRKSYSTQSLCPNMLANDSAAGHTDSALTLSVSEPTLLSQDN